MQKTRLIQWCERATSLIRFTPDKMAVYQELYDHLEERRDALMEQGLDEKEATGKTLEAMGDAEALAPQLAVIHPPFWGYMLRFSKILLVTLLCLSILPIWKYAKQLDLAEKPDFQEFDIYDHASYGSETGRTLHHMSQPGVSFSCDGSTFTATDAVVYTEFSEHFGTDRTYLYVLIRQTSIFPWTEHMSYWSGFSGIPSGFIIRDNLGNVYEGFHGQSSDDTQYMYSTGVQSGLFTYTHECWINAFPADADWVEIRYQRDGRDFTLHIDLTGGGRK